MASPVIGEMVQEYETPALELVYSEGADSRGLFDGYYDARGAAAFDGKPEGQQLTDIQSEVTAWISDHGILDLPESQEDRTAYYASFDREIVERKLGGLIEFLAQNHLDQISAQELHATRLFIDSTFAMYEDKPADGRDVLDDADGSFAFVVPARMARHEKEYGQEVEPVIPALRYVPNELRAQMMIGLPPFVIDTYARDEENGRRGYLILAPVYRDIEEDVESRSAKMRASLSSVNAAVDFAHRRFGVDVVGLGATLPAVTMYGQKITNPNVITTTGHGGTVELIAKTMENGLAAQGRSVETIKAIGMLGLGTIGSSAAEIIADRYPDTDMIIYDSSQQKIDRLVNEYPGRFSPATSDAELVETADVVISAIVGHFDTSKIDSMADTLVVDDSQPGSFEPEAVRRLGGEVLWVVGSSDQIATGQRQGYDYGTMVNARTDVFGCEAEAVVLSKYLEQLRQSGLDNDEAVQIVRNAAIRGPVNTDKARVMGQMFEQFGITASSPQAFGQSANFS